MSRVEVQVPALLLTALLQYLESGRASRSVWLLVWRSERLLALLRTSPSKRRTLRPPQKKRETSCTSFLILLLRRAQSILGTGNKTRSHCWRAILCEIVSLVQFIFGEKPARILAGRGLWTRTTGRSSMQSSETTVVGSHCPILSTVIPVVWGVSGTTVHARTVSLHSFPHKGRLRLDRLAEGDVSVKVPAAGQPERMLRTSSPTAHAQLGVGIPIR